MSQKDINEEKPIEIDIKKNDELKNQIDTTNKSDLTYNLTTTPLTGNSLISNLPPPPTIPSFCSVLPNPLPPNSINTEFTAAIPSNKGIKYGPPIEEQQEETHQHSSGLFGWMKDAVSKSAILNKFAETAKSSIDTIITTLDPQMNAFIYSLNDKEITIVSQKPEEILPIQNAIFLILGGALVNGSDYKPIEDTLVIGFDEGFKKAEEKITASLELHKTVTIALQNIIFHHQNSFYYLKVLMLKDLLKNINIKTFTSAIPIPIEKIFSKQMKNGGDSIEQIVCSNLENTEWYVKITHFHEESLFLAAKTLIKSYKNQIDN